jgi:hypothetical protein
MSFGTADVYNKIAETHTEKTNFWNDKFTSVFTKENLDQKPHRWSFPYKPMENIKNSEVGVKNNILTDWMRRKRGI